MNRCHGFHIWIQYEIWEDIYALYWFNTIYYSNDSRASFYKSVYLSINPGPLDIFGKYILHTFKPIKLIADYHFQEFRIFQLRYWIHYTNGKPSFIVTLGCKYHTIWFINIKRIGWRSFTLPYCWVHVNYCIIIYVSTVYLLIFIR